VVSHFAGFGASRRGYQTSSFECRKCANQCEVAQLVMDNAPSPAGVASATYGKESWSRLKRMIVGVDCLGGISPPSKL